MRRVVTVMAIILLPGGFAVAAVWWLWRRFVSYKAPADSLPIPTTPAAVTQEGNNVIRHTVRRRSQAAHASPAINKFLDEAPDELGFDLAIGQDGGDRTDATQAKLYAQGRTAPGDIVTNAKDTADTPHGIKASGYSYAVDVYPVDAAGKVRGTTKADAALPEVLAMFQQIRDCAVRHGLRSGADFKSLADRPHVEDPAWDAFKPKAVSTS